MNPKTTVRSVVGLSAILLLSGCVAGVGPDPEVTHVDDQTAPPVDSTVSSELEAVITVAGVDVDGLNVTVSGYVTGILEEGGECYYSFTGMSAESSVASSGHADRSVTTCGTSQVPIAQFTQGTWEVTMRYTALSGEETVSPPTVLEIP